MRDEAVRDGGVATEVRGVELARARPRGSGGDDVSDADGGDDVDGDMLNELERERERGKRGGRMWDKREAGAGVWCE